VPLRSYGSVAASGLCDREIGEKLGSDVRSRSPIDLGRQQLRRKFVIGGRYARGMTTAARSVAVVATRLPDIDRRALSQAWFSALHLAEPATGRAPAARPATAPPGGGGRPQRESAEIAKPLGGTRVPQRTDTSRLASIPLPQTERRKGGGELARRIERAIVKHVAREPQRAAAIAIDAGDGRVHLLVRTDRATTRIVALCSPHLRERVDRALAHARFALAACGTRIEVAG